MVIESAKLWYPGTMSHFDDFDDFLQEIGDTLNECGTQWRTTDMDIIDHVIYKLDYCDQVLCRYMSGADVENPNLIRELHQCINQLQVKWITHLNTIEGGGVAAAVGRPKKIVNVELVCYMDFYSLNGIVSSVQVVHVCVSQHVHMCMLECIHVHTLYIYTRVMCMYDNVGIKLCRCMCVLYL